MTEPATAPEQPGRPPDAGRPAAAARDALREPRPGRGRSWSACCSPSSGSPSSAGAARRRRRRPSPAARQAGPDRAASTPLPAPPTAPRPRSPSSRRPATPCATTPTPTQTALEWPASEPRRSGSSPARVPGDRPGHPGHRHRGRRPGSAPTSCSTACRSCGRRRRGDRDQRRGPGRRADRPSRTRPGGSSSTAPLLEPPYVLDVIGDPHTLARRCSTLRRGSDRRSSSVDGAQVQVEELDSLDIESTVRARAPASSPSRQPVAPSSRAE